MASKSKRKRLTGTQLNDDERDLVSRAAKSQSLTLSSYIRMRILPAARRDLAELEGDPTLFRAA